MSQAEDILHGLGGDENVNVIEPCITRLRVEVADPNRVSEPQLMEAGAFGVVQVGQTVQGGDQAGLVGTTGMSFGNHLHLVVRVEDEPVDPLPFIAANSK